MRIREVRDLSTRAITQFDVINELLFGGKPPQAFDPSKYYTTGDVVYVVNSDGTLTILQANTSGIFPVAQEPNFSEYNLVDVLEKQKETIEKLTGIRSKILPTIYEPHTFIFVAESDINEQDVEDIFKYTNTYHYTEVYLNGHYLPTAEYKVDFDTSKDRHHLVFEHVIPSGTRIMVRVNEAISLITRMINRINISTSPEKEVTVVMDTKNQFDSTMYHVEFTKEYQNTDLVDANHIYLESILTPATPLKQESNGSELTLELVTSGENKGRYHIDGQITSLDEDVKRYAVLVSTAVPQMGNIEDFMDILPVCQRDEWITLSTNLPNATPFFMYYRPGQKLAVDEESGEIVGYTVSNLPTIPYVDGVTILGIGLWIPTETIYTDQYFDIQVEIGQDAHAFEPFSYHDEYTFEDVVVPYPIDPNQIAMQYDLYINNIYTPTDMLEYDVVGEDIVITDWPGRKDASHDFVFTFDFIYTATNEIAILKQELVTTVEKKHDRYIVDLAPIDFVNSFQEVHAYINDEAYSPYNYSLQSGRMNIPLTESYLKEGDEVKVSMWTYILTDYAASAVRHNSQSVPVLTDATLTEPIPFLAYDENKYDMLVFNDAGIYLSYLKWFVDGYNLQYFEHDEGISWGNIIDFRLIEADESILMQNIYVPAEADNQSVFILPQNLNVFAFYMVFNAHGEYIPIGKYTVDGTTLRIDSQNALIRKDDVIEIIGFRYIDSMTATSFARQTVYASYDDQSMFNNPFTDYDPNTDSLLMFTNEGLYIGERFYTIVNDTIALQGSTVSMGGYLEFIRIRNSKIFYKVAVPEDYIDRGKVAIDDIYGDEIASTLMAIDLVKYKVMSENDTNFMRAKAKALAVTAKCNGVSYDASLIFSGTRCLLQIKTMDLSDGHEGIVADNVIEAEIVVTTPTVIRHYMFSIHIDPKDLIRIHLIPATSTGGSMIQPALTRLLKCFPIMDIQGMTEEYMKHFMNGEDVRYAFTYNDEPIDVRYTTTVDGANAFDFGDIELGGVIKGQILVNERGGDTMYSFEINITDPWYLVTTMLKINSIKLTDLESGTLKFKALYGETYQFTTKGNNYVDVRRFDIRNLENLESSEGTGEDLSETIGISALSDAVARDVLGDVVADAGVTVDKIDYLSGSITVTGDGSVARQGIYIPILGLMNQHLCYAVGADSISKSNLNAGQYIVELVITYGEAANPGTTIVGLTENILSAGIDLNNINNLLSVNLKIVTNDTDSLGIGKNTVTITGLRMNNVATALTRVEDFEPYTGMAPAPNLEYPQEITGVGVKTYNLFNDREFAKQSKSDTGFICELEWNEMTSFINFKQYENTSTEVMYIDRDIDTSLLEENHSYKLFYDSDITSDVTYNLIAVAGSNEVTGRMIIWNSMQMTNLKVRITFGPGANVPLTSAVRLWVVDVTVDPTEEWPYEPYGLKTEIIVTSGNLIDFSLIGTVKHTEADRLVFSAALDGRYDIYIEPESPLEYDDEGNPYINPEYHVEVGPITKNMTHYESMEQFPAGIYTILSNDTEAQLNPSIFFAVTYDDKTVELGNSGVFRKMIITEEMRSYDDFAVTYGFKVTEGLPITERAVYPMVIRTEGDGSEWDKDINMNNVLVLDYCNHDSNALKFFHTDYIYGRKTRYINRFNPAWLSSKTVNGISITNLEWGGFRISGERIEQANTIQTQKTFDHKSSLLEFKPGYYLMASCDATPNLAPYVYMKVRTGSNQELVASTSSQAFVVAHITEEMWLDQHFMVEIGIIAEGSDLNIATRTIMPILLYSKTKDYNWEGTGGIYKTNFVPYYPKREGLPVDIDTDRYGYSGNGYFYEGEGQGVYEYVRIVPFNTATLPASWSASDPLDGNKHAFVYPGFTNSIILPPYGDETGSDVVPDIVCDHYSTVSSNRKREMTNHITIDDSGNIWIYDDTMAEATAAEFTSYIRAMGAKLLIPMHSTYVKREIAIDEIQKGANSFTGYCPIMYIETTFNPPSYASEQTLQYELTYERREDIVSSDDKPVTPPDENEGDGEGTN